MHFPPKVQLDIAAADGEVKRVTEAIIATAFTGKVGNSKIFASPIEQVIRIRTGKTVNEAV